jgi:oxalate decarboxylase/phosphoglucose isomerase-like protein (cupin superfamily)
VAPESGQTFDFQAGDVGYVPVTSAHYLENTGDEDLVYLGMLAPAHSRDLVLVLTLYQRSSKLASTTTSLSHSG